MKFSSIRIALLSATAMCLYNLSFAQSLSDNALLFSRTVPGGSARIQGLGGAQTALGGDYSSALSNPAGLGMFNHSEFTFSPGLNILNTKTNYSGNSNATGNTVFNIPGISLIVHPVSTKTSGFLGGSFGVTVNRINDLNQSFSYQGTNSKSSLVDYFLYNSYDKNGNPLDPNSMTYNQNSGPGDNFYSITALGYNNYLTDYDSASNSYYSPLTPLANETRTELQKETVQRKGAQYQVSIAYGGNFSDKLYFGFSVGLTSIRYTLSQSFTESNFSYSEEPGYNPINDYRVDESLSIRGSGVNLTAGLIYRPVDAVQFGASIVTPTYYQITDTYNATVSTNWNNFDYYGDRSLILNNLQPATFDQPLVSNYSLTTPFKANAGLTVFVGKYGFITGDAEFVNYSNAKYADTSLYGISYADDNSEIKSTFTHVINYRVGGEFRKDIFRARLGYNLLADPYAASNGVDRKIQNFSGGVGIKNKKYSVDLTSIYSQSNNIRVPYPGFQGPGPGNGNQPPQLTLSNLNFVVTVGFSF